MSLGRFDRKISTLAVSVAVCAATLTAAPAPARAEGPVTSTGKGIVGGALLGGEIVMLTMGAIGIESGWPYIVFGGLGAVGGGIGGFFVEDAAGVDAAEAPMYMLAGGMALVIPTLIVTLNATMYKPPGDDKAEPVDNKPAVEPPPAGGSVTVTTSRAPRSAPVKARSGAIGQAAPRPHLRVSLVDIHQGQLALGLPAPEVRPVYTKREIADYGQTQRHEIRVPVFQTSF